MFADPGRPGSLLGALGPLLGALGPLLGALGLLLRDLGSLLRDLESVLGDLDSVLSRSWLAPVWSWGSKRALAREPVWPGPNHLNPHRRKYVLWDPTPSRTSN